MKLQISTLIAIFILVTGHNLYSKDFILDKAFFVREGFSREWTYSLPVDRDRWTVTDPGERRKHSIRIQDLPISGKPVRKFFSIEEPTAATYTIVTAFDIPARAELEKGSLGLWIPQIAENWEIYLNGKLVRSEMFLDKDGTIVKFRNMRDVLTYLNPLHLRVGENILAFRIVGDPAIPDTGFYQDNPLKIAGYERLERTRAKMLPLILICLYLVVGLYHLILFFVRRTERYNLVFALFSLMLFIYLFSRTSHIYTFIPDTRYSYLVEFCSLYTLFPLALYFMDLLLVKRVRLFVHAYGLYCCALIVLSMAVPYAMRIDILRLWQYTSPAAMAYFLVAQVGRSFRNQLRERLDSGRGATGPGLAASVARTIAKTTSGNLLIGSLVAAACALFDIVNSIYFNIPVVITNYGFLAFVMGVTVMLSNRFVYLYRKIDGLNLDLKEKTRDLKETRVKYDFSQEKYRLLVEKTNDAIFALDENLNFLTANRALLDMLDLDEKSILTRSLLELIHETDERSVTAQFTQEKIEEFLREDRPMDLKIDFKTALGIEPVTLQVHLEPIRIEGRKEIFGRGTSVTEDVLNRYLQAERQHYRIGNLLLVADDLSYRITRNLEKYMNRRDRNLVRIAVREIIINAIEHGNLAITFDEKSREVMGENYFQYLNERQRDPRFRDRTVSIEYEVNSERVVFTITDQGEGFDYGKYLRGDVDANSEMLAHGRGITLARNIFDEIRFNEAGNGVSLVKQFRENN